MKKQLIISLSLLLILQTPLLAQPDRQEINIGDTLPPLSLEGVINHPTGTISLGDYRGRWLILDFWATWCAPCIEMFPKADSLEHLFEGKLAFLPITYQSAEEVQRSFGRKQLQGLSPAIVTADNTLRQLFPHKMVPHYVWVDPEGVVRATTGPEEVNRENIRAVLAQGGGAAQLRTKEDNFLPFGRYDHLGTLNPMLPEDAIRYSSTLTGYIEGMPGFYTWDPPGPGKPGRIIMTNHSLLGLYRTLYSTATEYYGLNRVVWEVADRSPLESEDWKGNYGDWLRAGNGYCYELQVPPHMAGQEWALAREDLDRFFPQYRARVEVRKHPVLALVRTKREDRFRSGGGKPRVEETRGGLRLQNAPFSALLMRLNSTYMQQTPAPLVDLTSYQEGVDLVLEADFADLEAVRKALQAYGLDLVEQKARIPVLVIRDVPAKERKGS